MDVQQILLELTDGADLPVAALRAADQNRIAVLPAFLDEIDHYLAAGPEQRRQPNAVFYVFHLLGSWRGKTANRPLPNLVRGPPTHIDQLLGAFSIATSHL